LEEDQIKIMENNKKKELSPIIINESRPALVVTNVDSLDSREANSIEAMEIKKPTASSSIPQENDESPSQRNEEDHQNKSLICSTQQKSTIEEALDVKQTSQDD
jgi:hypothetical protein